MASSLPSEEAISRAREQNRVPTKGYSWTVSNEEVTIVVPLAEGVGKRDVKVVCKVQSLSVAVQDKEIINGPWHARSTNNNRKIDFLVVIFIRTQALCSNRSKRMR
jgi:glutamine amidotransferase PdxT